MRSTNPLGAMSAIQTAVRCAAVVLLLLVVVSPPRALAQWQTATGPIPPGTSALASNATTAFMGVAADDIGGPVWRSTDGGRTWALTEGIAPAGLLAHGGAVYGGTAFAGIWRSADDGLTWARVAGISSNASGAVLAASGTRLFAVAFEPTGHGGLYRSTDNGVSWAPVTAGLPPDPRVSAALSRGPTALAGVGAEIYRSTDRGATWAPVGLGLPPGAQVDAFAAEGATYYAAVGGATPAFGVYRSTDDGQMWARIGLAQSPSATFRFTGLIARGAELFAAVLGDEPFDSGLGGLHRSTDSGVSWARVWNGHAIENWALAVRFLDGDVAIGTAGNGPFRSADGGATWTYTAIWTYTGSGSSELFPVTALHAEDGLVLAGLANSFQGRGIRRSTDGGVAWQLPLGIPNNVFPTLLGRHGGTLFAGVEDFGTGTLFRSTDDGASWTPSSSGLPQGQAARAVVAHGGAFFAGVSSPIGAPELLYRSGDGGAS